MKWVGALEAEQVGAAVRAALELELYQDAGDWDGALDAADRLLAATPESSYARLSRARALAFGNRGLEAAIETLTELVQLDPACEVAWSELGIYRFWGENAAAAKATLQAALAAGVNPASLESAQRLLYRADHGPAWNETHDSKTQHYHVRTNIDEHTAWQVGRELEAAYDKYSRALGRVREADDVRFPVYVFAGQEGYLDYWQDIDGVKPHGTAGIYHPILKQLLIWNTLDSERMIKTARHEGFHQYLDARMDDPPRWFNEGLAEYYEVSELERGVWREGAPHPDHVPQLEAVLKRNLALESFMRMSSAEFNRDMQSNYAQAWATVHFLLHGTKQSKAIFEKLFEALLNGSSRDQAVDAALQGVNTRALQEAFREHVGELVK